MSELSLRGWRVSLMLGFDSRRVRAKTIEAEARGPNESKLSAYRLHLGKKSPPTPKAKVIRVFGLTGRCTTLCICLWRADKYQSQSYNQCIIAIAVSFAQSKPCGKPLSRHSRHENKQRLRVTRVTSRW